MNKISNNNESLAKYFVELFTADDDHVESENVDIYSDTKGDSILFRLSGFRGVDFSLCEFTVKVETVNNKNIVSFLYLIKRVNGINGIKEKLLINHV